MARLSACRGRPGCTHTGAVAGRRPTTPPRRAAPWRATATRWFTSRSRTTTSQPSKIWSPPRKGACSATFVPASGKSSGEPSRQRLVDTDDRRQGLVVDDDCLGRVDRSGARLGHNRGDQLADESNCVGGEQRQHHRLGHRAMSTRFTGNPTSAAVYTPTTPGIDRASAVSIPAIRACATVEVT